MTRILEILKRLWDRSMVHRAMLVAPPVALILWMGYITVGARAAAQYFTAKVERGDISQVVQATGTINPVNIVPVGSVVSGNVVSLSVDFNSQVKKDDVLAQIDPVPFEMALDQSKADYQNALANVTSLEAQVQTSGANVETMKANVAKAQATLTDADVTLKRTKMLTEQGVYSQQQQDDAQANYDTALASLNAAKAQEAQAEAQLNATVAQRDQAKAQVQMKKAAVDAAQLQLSYCTIRAPIDGTVINRTVNVGQPVAASLQAPNLFSIGEDLKHMLVYSNTDEADVGRIKVGREATFRVDSFPREIFHGTVSQVRMNATTIQNVVTYNTMIAFDNPDLRLFPGMTAYVTIPVAEAKNVVKIPNGALRFKPDISDSERAALYAKYGIPETTQATAAGRIAAAGSSEGGVASSSSPTGATVQAQNEQVGGTKPATTAEQGAGGALVAAKPKRADTGIVWRLLPNKTLEPVQVTLGVTDFTFTELISGNVKPGDDLVIGQSVSKSTTAQSQARSPVGGPAGTTPGVPRRF
jgi:HlyD family secretion protein